MSAQSPRSTANTAVWLLAVLLAGAAVIHLVMVPAHAEASKVEAVLFAITGWAQAGLAAALLLRPARPLVPLAIAVSLAVLAAWICSRTVGLPFGAQHWVAEPVGQLDSLCAGLELLTVLGGWAFLSRPTFGSQISPEVVTVMAMILAATTTVMLLSPAGQHGHEATDRHGTAADDHVVCTDPVTDAQKQAAAQLVVDTRAAVARYADFAAAQADGFVPITPPSGKVVHYAVPQRMADGQVLVPAAVESLVYAKGQAGKRYFIGAMYLADTRNLQTPAPGGCLTVWHAHDNLCLDDTGVVAVVNSDGSCPPGSANRITPPMLHVWAIDLPEGPFAELDQIKPGEIATGIRNAGPDVVGHDDPSGQQFD